MKKDYLLLDFDLKSLQKTAMQDAAYCISELKKKQVYKREYVIPLMKDFQPFVAEDILDGATSELMDAIPDDDTRSCFLKDIRDLAMAEGFEGKNFRTAFQVPDVALMFVRVARQFLSKKEIEEALDDYDLEYDDFKGKIWRCRLERIARDPIVMMANEVEKPRPHGVWAE